MTTLRPYFIKITNTYGDNYEILVFADDFNAANRIGMQMVKTLGSDYQFNYVYEPTPRDLTNAFIETT